VDTVTLKSTRVTLVAPQAQPRHGWPYPTCKMAIRAAAGSAGGSGSDMGEVVGVSAGASTGAGVGAACSWATARATASGKKPKASLPQTSRDGVGREVGVVRRGCGPERKAAFEEDGVSRGLREGRKREKL